MRKNQSLTGGIDWILLAVVLLLMVMGVATVYSTAYNADHPSLFDFSQKYGKQVIWMGVSLFLGLLVFLIDSYIYRKFAVPIYLFTIALLIIVLFMPEKNGAHSWLGIGSMGIQPAEFAKIGTAILLARFLSSTNLNRQNRKTVLRANYIIIIPMILILLQPDAGTFIVFGSFLFVLYREGISFDPIILFFVNLIPGVRFKHSWIGVHFIPILFVTIFLSVATLIISDQQWEIIEGTEISGYWKVFTFLICLVVVGYFFMRMLFSRRDRKRALTIALIGFVLMASLSATVKVGFDYLAEHQKDRIELALGLKEDPDGDDYNRNRAMAAVGSGGLVGKGYRNAIIATVETNHVPESETDFIFCPFAEEWGFMGSITLVSLYLFMMLRIVIIAERQRSIFNRAYAYSVAMILFLHFAINIGMNIEFAPVIGIPLPFFSYGGSSIMSFSMMMFILLKLDSQRKDVLI